MQVQARARRPGRSPGVSVHQEAWVGGRGVEDPEAPERAADHHPSSDELRVWRRRRRSVARASPLGRRAARRSRRDDAVSIDTRLSTSVRRDTKTTLGCHADLLDLRSLPALSSKRRARKKHGRLESGKKRLEETPAKRARNAATARDHRSRAASVARTRNAPGSRRRDARGRRRRESATQKM